MNRLFACAVLAAAAAHADGECTPRPSTKAELAFAAKVRALGAALPKAPAGWTADDVDVGAPGETMCKENDAAFKAGRARLTGSVYVQFHNGEDRSALAEKAAAVQIDPKDQKRIDELTAENSKVAKAAGEAAGKNDMAAMERHMERAKAIAAEVERLSSKARTQREAIFAEAQRDTQASVAIRLGETEWHVNCDKNTPVKVAGAVAAFRSACPAQSGRTGGDPDVTGETTVFLGPWTAKTENEQIVGAAKVDAPYTAVVTIRADDARSEELLKKVDFAAVKAALR